DADDFGSEDLEDELEPAAAAGAAAAAAAAASDDSPPKAEKKKKKSSGDKKPLLIPGIITGAAGAVLGAAAVAAMYFMAPPPPPMEIEEPALAMLEEPPPPPPPAPLLTEDAAAITEPVPAAEPLEEIQEVEEIVVVEEPPPPTMDQLPVAPVVEAPPQPVKRPRTTRFFVQVANCIYQECVDDYRYLLKRAGYATRVETVNEVNPMTEIVSTNLYGEEEASNLVNRINNENLITGQAYRKPSSSSFQISLGLFPDLTTANRVKAHLNQIYSAEVFFEARRSDQRIRNYRVYAGGFKTKNEALDLQKILEEKDRRFEGMFVVAMSE
ncbi:MAG: SPOR domain-containing protein, partial [Deltaproteobacteria bacterium]